MKCYSVLSLLCVLLLPTVGRCGSERSRQVTIAQAYGDFSWTQEAWTGNDKSYQQARAVIEAQLAAGENAKTLTQNLRAKALQRPENALAQFRWAYAAWAYSINQTVPVESAEKVLPDALVALASVPSTHAYNYARLRFLILAFRFPPPQLKDVGIRLLKKNPQDTQVKYSLASTLDNSESAQDRQQARVYAQQLAQQYPKVARYQGLLAGIAYRDWFYNKTRTTADQAIAAYQHYLQVSGPNEVFRDNAESLIKFIQQQQAYVDQK